MKKKIKYIAAAGAVLAMAMMLCSCKQLDDLKLNHAVYVEKDKTDKIEFRGKTYNLYNMTAAKNEYSLMINEETYARVTEPDVPVLLAEHRGKSIVFNDCGDEAPLFFAMDYRGALENQTKYYCQSDSAATFEEIVKGAKMDHLFILTSNWDEEKKEYHTEPALFSDAATDAIVRTINRPFNQVTDVTDMGQIPSVSGKYLEPQFCDKSVLFTDNRVVQIIRAANSTDEKYYIACRELPDAYNVYDPDAYDEAGALKDVEWRLVDAKDAKTVKALFKEFEDNAGTFSMYN